MYRLLILIGGAALPAFLIIMWIRKLDRARAEPIGLIWKSVLFGFISTVFAIVLEIGLSFVENFIANSMLRAVWASFVTAALAEEGVKYFFFKRYLYKNPAFNKLLDGIVYAICISLGYAFAENIIYGWNAGIQILFLRAFTSVPLHAAVTGIMGYYLAKAKAETKPELSKKLRRKGFVIAFIIHGLYDFFLMVPTRLFILSLVVLFISTRMLMSSIREAKEYDDVWNSATKYQ